MSIDSTSSDPTAELQTLNVFVDTSVFRNKKFDVSSGALKTFGQLGQQGKIQIYSTFIIEGEAKKNLEEEVDDALKQSTKLNIHFRNIGLPEINIENQKETRLKRWQEYIAASKVTFIPIPEHSIETVFSLYFESKPPFQRDARKRHEFPDAFNIEALKAWCFYNEDWMYVIASDGGLIEACDGDSLIPLNKLEEFLDLYNRRELSLYQRARAFFDHYRHRIEDFIKELIEETGFEVADISNYNVSDVEVSSIELHEPLITKSDEYSASIDVDADIHLSAYINYSDSEAMGSPNISENVFGSLSTTVFMDFAYLHSRVENLGYPNERFRVTGKKLGRSHEAVLN